MRCNVSGSAAQLRANYDVTSVVRLLRHVAAKTAQSRTRPTGSAERNRPSSTLA